MTKTDYVGLLLTIISFGVILVPIAVSNADPYNLKGILEEVIGNIPLIDNLDKNQDANQYTIIIHLKQTPDDFSDISEKIVLGRYRTSVS